MEADACGVCNGGNSTSTLVTDSASGVLPIVGNNFYTVICTLLHLLISISAYTDVVTIPVGARHVDIRDVGAGNNVFMGK